MRFKSFPSILLLALLSLCFAQVTYSATTPPETLARLAVSENSVESATAIRGLREMGPVGLRALMEIYRDEIKRQRGTATIGKDTNPEWLRLSAALDAVSQQRNSYASGLYWYTDIEQARRASDSSGKPILSLRLLGNLSEEFSCANSRFFRTVLYSNREVSDYLRERFILHWKSVRPAPRVTVDFGDGRKLERTLTGNSIHYVLDTQGRVVDALPGLYGPKAFLRGLAQAEEVVRQYTGKTEAQQTEIFYRYHRTRINQTAADWSTDVQRSGGRVPDTVLARVSARRQTPDAIEIAPLAMTKRVVEIDILKAMTTDATELEAATNLEVWTKIAALHAADARLDEQSIAMIGRHTPVGTENASAMTHAQVELLRRTVEKLERNMALDTVRNEYVLRNRIHAWLANRARNMSVDALNEKVYAELFLTPGNDPWLGLYSADTYTALENGGLVN